MTNEQLIFHIYGSHCEKYIYICGTWGPFYDHSGSILLLSSPFTNINLHVNNPKYDFCSCLGGPGGPFAESKVPKCQRIKRPHHNGDICTTRKMTSSSYMGHDVKTMNNFGYWGGGGGWQCLGGGGTSIIGLGLHVKYGSNLIRTLLIKILNMKNMVFCRIFWAVRGSLH